MPVTREDFSESEWKELVREHGRDYLSEEYPDDLPMDMDEIEMAFSSVQEALTRAFYGGRYGFEADSFNPNDAWFCFDGNGNIKSIPYIDDYLDDVIDEDLFIEWCMSNGYIDEPWEDEEDAGDED